MICGFINKDYTIEYKELSKEESEEFCLDNKYFSINLNSEYLIYIDKEIYNEENLNELMPKISELGRELFLKNKK